MRGAGPGPGQRRPTTCPYCQWVRGCLGPRRGLRTALVLALWPCEVQVRSCALYLWKSGKEAGGLAGHFQAAAVPSIWGHRAFLLILGPNTRSLPALLVSPALPRSLWLIRSAAVSEAFLHRARDLDLGRREVSPLRCEAGTEPVSMNQEEPPSPCLFVSSTETPSLVSPLLPLLGAFCGCPCGEGGHAKASAEVKRL